MLREKLSTSVLIQIINFSNWVPLRCDISYLAMLLLSIKTISDRRLFLLLFFQNVTVVRFAISSTVQLFSVGLVDRNVHFVWLIHLKSKKKKRTRFMIVSSEENFLCPWTAKWNSCIVLLVVLRYEGLRLFDNWNIPSQLSFVVFI